MLVHEQPLLLEEVLKGRKTVTAERVGFFREQTSAASASNPQTPSRMGSGQSTTSHQPKFHAEWQVGDPVGEQHLMSHFPRQKS